MVTRHMILLFIGLSKQERCTQKCKDIATLLVKNFTKRKKVLRKALNWNLTGDMLKSFLFSLYNSSYDVNSVEIFKSGDIKVDKFINSLLNFIEKNKLM